MPEQKKKRRVNRAFNCYIAPRLSDIERVDVETNQRIKAEHLKSLKR